MTKALCIGLCHGARDSASGPARYGTLGDGTRVLWCPCCEQALVYVGPTDPPNVQTEMKALFVATRYTDPVCGYDTVSLSHGPSTLAKGRN